MVIIQVQSTACALLLVSALLSNAVFLPLIMKPAAVERPKMIELDDNASCLRPLVALYELRSLLDGHRSHGYTDGVLCLGSVHACALKKRNASLLMTIARRQRKKRYIAVQMKKA